VSNKRPMGMDAAQETQLDGRPDNRYNAAHDLGSNESKRPWLTRSGALAGLKSRGQK
jgi:hypothetical protein